MRRVRTSRSPIASIAAVLFLGAGTGAARAAAPAPADAAKARANLLYAAADAAYAVKNLERAVALWRAGYELGPNPAVLYNVAQALRNLGDCAEANWHYKAFLREAASDDPSRPRSEEAVKACDALIASGASKKVTIHPLTAAEVEAIAPAAPAGPSDGKPGGEPEFPDGKGDGEGLYDYERPRSPALLIGAGVAGGIAVVTAAVAIVFSVAAVDATGDAVAATGVETYDDAVRRARLDAALANVFWITAGVAGAAAGGLVVARLAGGGTVAATPVVGREGLFVAVSLSF